MSEVKAEFEVIQAWIKIKPWLDDKKRGDDILRAEIEAIGGIFWRKLKSRILTELVQRRGWTLVAIPKKGWHIETDDQQISDGVNRHNKRAVRQKRKALHAAVMANPTTEQGKALKSHYVNHIGAQLAQEEAARVEVKTILGAPPPRPQLKAGGVKK